LNPRILESLGDVHHHPESQSRTEKLWVESKSAAATGAPGIQMPAATADHPVRIAAGADRIVLTVTPVGLWMVEVPTPFPHVSAHVIKTQAVGRFAGHRSGIPTAVFIEPKLSDSPFSKKVDR